MKEKYQRIIINILAQEEKGCYNMQGEKEKVICTVFKWSDQIKKKAKEESRDKKLSVSELLTAKLEAFLSAKSEHRIPKLEKGKISLKSTSVLLPEGVHLAARHKSIEHKVSLADIFRYCLSK